VLEHIAHIADHMKLLGDKTRLAILGLLRTRELCVCDLVSLLAMSQPAVSQHLRKLKTAGLVRESCRGQWVYYSLNTEGKPHVQAVLEHLPDMEERLRLLPPDRCC
jgi:ArsR family transcriptional regulator